MQMQKLKRIGLAHAGLAHAKNLKKTFAFPVQEIKKNFAHAIITRKTDMATRQT